MAKRKKSAGKLGWLWLWAIFALSLFYYEAVFRMATVGEFWKLSTLAMLLFSLSFGTLGYFLSTLTRSKTANAILGTLLLTVTAVIFLVEYFVFRSFKIFYDVKTVVGGAGDVAGGFTSEIFNLVFSLDGLCKIGLFLLPSVVFAAASRWLAHSGGLGLRRRLVILLTMILTYGSSVALVFSSPVCRSIYKDEYNFQSAVGNFGLLTGIRLDISRLFADPGGEGFDIVDIPTFPPVTDPPTTPGPTDPTQTVPETTVPEETKPIEYGYNEMELEFPSTGNGYYKSLNEYVQAMTASKQNPYTGLFEGKNLIFITAEAFSAEVIDPELTPTLYRLANKGIQFTDYYQPSSAGTTGGEYQNIFGMLPTEGGMSFKETVGKLNYFTLGSQLDRLGYYGMAYHNNSYTFYSRHKTHKNLGYSNGYMGYGNGMEEFVKNQWPQSDLEMIQGTLPTYIGKEPFNIYYMTVSGHSNYTTIGNCMTKKNWDKVQDLPYSDLVKGYFAANLELEYAMEYLVQELEAQGIADDTVIVIAADHFPYGLDDEAGGFAQMKNLEELYGHPIADSFDRDHSRLIIWSGCLEEMDPIVVDSPTSSLDILPTLSNLFGTEFDSRLMPGRDVFSGAPALVYTTGYDWKTEYGTYYASSGTFVPVSEDIQIPEGYVEQMKTIVRNRVRFCSYVLKSDYYRYLFG